MTKFCDIKISDAHMFEIDNNGTTTHQDILTKLKLSEDGYDTRNRQKIENQEYFFCSFVGYYPSDKRSTIDLEYHSAFQYNLDRKITNRTLKECREYIKIITDKSNQLERDSNIVEDSNMKEYLKNKRWKKEQQFSLYYLKVYCKESLTKLLQHKFSCDANIQKILKLSFDIIQDKNTSLENRINNIHKILKFYEKLYKYKWVKSQGEFYSLITILLFFSCSIQINQKNIPNPYSSRTLELDFYLSEEFLALEIDGKQHKTNKNMKANDLIKSVILHNGNIHLIRINWDSNKFSQFVSEIYHQMDKFYKEKRNMNCSIDFETYYDLLSTIKNRVVFPTLTYKLQITNILPISTEDRSVTDDELQNIILKRQIQLYLTNYQLISK